MARFDVYKPKGRPLTLDVQSDLLASFSTRVIVPLLSPSAVPAPLKTMHPVFEFEGSSLVLATHLIAAVSQRILGRPHGNLARYHDDVVRALDMLFTGF